jgi:hypothetical protein
MDQDKVASNEARNLYSESFLTFDSDNNVDAFSLVSALDNSSANTAANYGFMLKIPLEIWRLLLSDFLAVRSVDPQLSLRIFPCVCRLWREIESQHTSLWPLLVLQDFRSQKPLALMSECMKAKNEAQAV